MEAAPTYGMGPGTRRRAPRSAQAVTPLAAARKLIGPTDAGTTGAPDPAAIAAATRDAGPAIHQPKETGRSTNRNVPTSSEIALATTSARGVSQATSASGCPATSARGSGPTRRAAASAASARVHHPR